MKNQHKISIIGGGHFSCSESSKLAEIKKAIDPISVTGTMKDLGSQLVEETSLKLERLQMEVIDDSYKIRMTNSVNGSKNGQLEKRITKNRKKNKLAKKARKRK